MVSLMQGKTVLRKPTLLSSQENFGLIAKFRHQGFTVRSTFFVKDL